MCVCRGVCVEVGACVGLLVQLSVCLLNYIRLKRLDDTE